MQVVEAATLDARRVEEHVFSTPRADESETLFRQPLDGAFSHLCVSLAIVGLTPLDLRCRPVVVQWF
jgi:hypothetical protein